MHIWWTMPFMLMKMASFAITMKMHRLGIEQAANSALGGNLMLELLKEFVGRMTPNDRKVRTLNFVLAWKFVMYHDIVARCIENKKTGWREILLPTFELTDFVRGCACAHGHFQCAWLFFSQDVLAFLDIKIGCLRGGREDQAILESYVGALKGLGKKDKRGPQQR